MGIKRYTAFADTTITNAFKANMTSHATGSNMGAADSMEIFHIYGQAQGTSSENSRLLVKFPTDNITSDRSAGSLPASGNVSFYLRMFNAVHPFTVPTNYTLMVKAISRNWDEGTGLDADSYSDYGYCNWVAAQSQSSGVTAWTTEGGDYQTSLYYSSNFVDGTEDLEVDITGMVEYWLAGTYTNYGVGVMLSSSHEVASSSYYSKKFFARSSQYFYKRPVIEARWDSADKDDRANFFYSSSLAGADDNKNTLFLYNYVRGQLKNLPHVSASHGEAGGTGSVYIHMYSGSADNSKPDTNSLIQVSVSDEMSSSTPATGSWVSTGVYSVDVCMTAASTPVNRLFDVWCTGEIDDTQWHTGSIYPELLEASDYNPTPRHVTKITNLKAIYHPDETARFRLFVREKGWSPSIYSKATATIPNLSIDSGSFKIYRITDDYVVIPHGTGSTMETQLSFDVSGNYFDLDMELLEPGYGYAIQFAYYNGALSSYVEQPEAFKFRVEKHES
jgi:hypothetical protein